MLTQKTILEEKQECFKDKNKDGMELTLFLVAL
jgi:hypothetical protein